MPIIQREIQDLHEAFAEDEKLAQMVMDLDLPEVALEGISPENARLRAAAARQALESRDNEAKPAWLNEYFMLLDKGWPFRQAAYIAWASTPSDGRNPKTQQELAKLLGLTSDRAFSTWRTKNPAIIETIALMQQAALWDGRADAFRNLREGMKRAGEDYKFFAHLKLYLEMTGDYVPTSQFMADLKKKISNDPSELSEEEITMLAKAYEGYQEIKENKGIRRAFSDPAQADALQAAMDAEDERK